MSMLTSCGCGSLRRVRRSGGRSRAVRGPERAARLRLLREVQGDDLFGLLSRLIRQHEFESPYRLEGLPQDFVQKEMKGVFGFAMDVTRVDAGYKLSQNRNDEDHVNIIRELELREDADSKNIAGAMRKKRAAQSNS